eukprot:1705807-Rhodomonas_salina.1
MAQIQGAGESNVELSDPNLLTMTRRDTIIRSRSMTPLPTSLKTYTPTRTFYLSVQQSAIYADLSHPFDRFSSHQRRTRCWEHYQKLRYSNGIYAAAI